MKTLTDRGILWRTFPVIPRKRVRFDPNIPTEFPLFGSKDPVFKCMGGYFTHNSYNLLDWIVTYWGEMATRQWLQKFRQDRPTVLKDQIDRLKEITPILGYKEEDLLRLQKNLPEIQNHFRDYLLIPGVSDLEMRKHPALNNLSSLELKELIERTSKARIKTIYPVRILDGAKRDPKFTYFYEMNLGETEPWSHLFEYRVLDERKSKSGKVIERSYKFLFTGLLSMLMIHNTICQASWNMNPKVYGLSPDAQLLYRYLIITGSRNRINRIDYIGHRLGWREPQKKRLAKALEPIMRELTDTGLIGGFKMIAQKGKKYFCEIEIGKNNPRRSKNEKGKVRSV